MQSVKFSLKLDTTFPLYVHCLWFSSVVPKWNIFHQSTSLSERVQQSGNKFPLGFPVVMQHWARCVVAPAAFHSAECQKWRCDGVLHMFCQLTPPCAQVGTDYRDIWLFVLNLSFPPQNGKRSLSFPDSHRALTSWCGHRCLPPGREVLYGVKYHVSSPRRRFPRVLPKVE